MLSPILARKKSLAEEIAGLDVAGMTARCCPSRRGTPPRRRSTTRAYDIITLQKLVEREYTIPEPQTAEEVICYYAKRIAQDVKLPSQFAALVPKVREFLETVAFGERVDLSRPAMIKAIATSSRAVRDGQDLRGGLARPCRRGAALRRLESAGRRLSETQPFPFSRPTFAAEKTVFNLVAADNEFEREFARFLEDAPDVVALCQAPGALRLRHRIHRQRPNLRYYEPDFVASDTQGTHFVIETKGREDVDVAYKDRAAPHLVRERHHVDRP